MQPRRAQMHRPAECVPSRFASAYSPEQTPCPAALTSSSSAAVWDPRQPPARRSCTAPTAQPPGRPPQHSAQAARAQAPALPHLRCPQGWRMTLQRREQQAKLAGSGLSLQACSDRLLFYGFGVRGMPLWLSSQPDMRRPDRCCSWVRISIAQKSNVLGWHDVVTTHLGCLQKLPQAALGFPLAAQPAGQPV